MLILQYNIGLSMGKLVKKLAATLAGWAGKLPIWQSATKYLKEAYQDQFHKV